MKVKEFLKFINPMRSEAPVVVHVYDNSTKKIETHELCNYALVHIADKKFPAIPDVGNATLESYEIRMGRLIINASVRRQS